MINVSVKQDVSMVQGDVGGIEFSLDCISLNDDIVCLIIVDGDNIVKHINGVIKEGDCYFLFNKDTTNLLNPKNYKYHINVVSLLNGIDYNVISNKNFNLEEGFNCE